MHVHSINKLVNESERINRRTIKNGKHNGKRETSVNVCGFLHA